MNSIHGSAPDIANQDIANPFGMILSLALCLRESLNQPKAAKELEDHVFALIKSGKTTADLGGQYKTSEIFKLLKESIFIKGRRSMMGLTLFDKVWNKHVLHGNEGEPQYYI